MNEAIITAIVALVQEGIKIYPTLASELSDIFATKNPTPEDWQALKQRVLATPFETLAPNAAANLPIEESQPETVTVPGVVTLATVASQPTPDAAAPQVAAVVMPQNQNPNPVCPDCGKTCIPNSPDNCNC